MAYRYRLRPELSQVPVPSRHGAHGRFVWNLALEEANCYRPGRLTPGAVEGHRQLDETREGTWLSEASSHEGDG